MNLITARRFLLHLAYTLICQGLIMAVAIFGHIQAWLCEFVDSFLKQKVSDKEFCVVLSTHAAAIFMVSQITHASWEYTLGALLVLPAGGALLWALLVLAWSAIRDVKKMHDLEERIEASSLPVLHETTSVWRPAFNIVLSGVLLLQALCGAGVAANFLFHKSTDAVAAGMNQLIEWQINSYSYEDAGELVVSTEPSHAYTLVKGTLDTAKEQMEAFRHQWPFIKRVLFSTPCNAVTNDVVTNRSNNGNVSREVQQSDTPSIRWNGMMRYVPSKEYSRCEELFRLAVAGQVGPLGDASACFDTQRKGSIKQQTCREDECRLEELAPHEVRGATLMRLIHSGAHLPWHMTAYGMPLYY